MHPTDTSNELPGIVTMIKAKLSLSITTAAVVLVLEGCGGGGGNPTSSPVTTGSSANIATSTAPTAIPATPTSLLVGSQASADNLTDFALLQLKQVSSDAKGMASASGTAAPTLQSDSISTKSVSGDAFVGKTEKAVSTVDYSAICKQSDAVLALYGLVGCAGIMTIDNSYASNLTTVPAGAYSKVSFANVSITTSSPRETNTVNGGFRFDYLTATTLNPLTGKVKMVAANLTATTSTDVSPAKPVNFEFTAEFINGRVTAYEDLAKLYSVANLVTTPYAAGTIISGKLRSLFENAHIDINLINAKISDKAAVSQIQMPFSATLTGANGTKGTIALNSVNAAGAALGTVSITNASGTTSSYNVSRPL
jgi:hypothetical protein